MKKSSCSVYGAAFFVSKNDIREMGRLIYRRVIVREYDHIRQFLCKTDKNIKSHCNCDDLVI